MTEDKFLTIDGRHYILDEYADLKLRLALQERDKEDDTR